VVTRIAHRGARMALITTIALALAVGRLASAPRPAFAETIEANSLQTDTDPVTPPGTSDPGATIAVLVLAATGGLVAGWRRRRDDPSIVSG
jgi:hypothetical protein